jgi:hypothetical protein
MNDTALDRIFAKHRNAMVPTFDSIGVRSDAERRAWLALFPNTKLGSVEVPFHAREWRRVGADPAEAGRWLTAGIETDTALTALAAGLTYESYAASRDAHGTSDPIAAACVLRAGGVSNRETYIEYPRVLAATYGRLWPGIWSLYDRYAKTPDRFVDSMIVASFVNELLPDLDENEIIPVLLHFVSIESHTYSFKRAFALQAWMIAEWRQTQGLYTFDPDVRDAIERTDLADDFPPEPLQWLPEPTVWIARYSERDGRVDSIGSLLSLIPLTHDDRPAPYLAVVSASALDRGTLSYPVATMTLSDMRAQITDESHSPDAFYDTVKLALYLASEEPDMEGTPRPIVPTRTKRGMRYFPPNEPQTWNVGYRLGPALRAALGPRTHSDGSTGRSVRAHPRKAHFHRWRLGKRDSASFTYRVKWLPPIIVNAARDNVTPDDSPAVIRRVE